MSKSVDEWLNEVDYSFKDYKPSDYTLKYINFIQLASGDSLENKTPLVYLKMCDALFSKNKNTAMLCHRGIAKTSIAAEFLILYIAAFGEMPNFGKVDFLIYVADSVENGVKSLRKNVEYRYNNSEFLQKLIPNMNIKYTDENGEEADNLGGRKFTDVRMEFMNKRGDRFAVRMYGAKTGIRGAKEYGKRPQVAIIDDILSDEDARSETILSAIEDTIYKGVKYALNPTRSKIVWLGTPFNAKDPLYKAVESGAYEVACYPVCEKFPCERDEFRGSWEERFSYDFVKSSYEEAVATGKVASFNQELMLRITDTKELLVDNANIIMFDKELVLRNKESYNFYITTDLATSAKQSADFSVISVWAINNKSDYLLVDGWAKKTNVEEFIDQLFRFARTYNPLGVGVEVSGQQGGFISWIQAEMIRRNIFFNLLSSNNNGEAGIRPIKNKFERFSLFVPRFKQNKVWIAKEMKDTRWGIEFFEEISKATKTGFKSKHDDILDTISMLGSFEIYAPSYNDSYYDTNESKDIFTIRNTLF